MTITDRIKLNKTIIGNNPIKADRLRILDIHGISPAKIQAQTSLRIFGISGIGRAAPEIFTLNAKEYARGGFTVRGCRLLAHAMFHYHNIRVCTIRLRLTQSGTLEIYPV